MGGGKVEARKLDSLSSIFHIAKVKAWNARNIGRRQWTEVQLRKDGFQHVTSSLKCSTASKNREGHENVKRLCNNAWE